MESNHCHRHVKSIRFHYAMRAYLSSGWDSNPLPLRYQPSVQPHELPELIVWRPGIEPGYLGLQSSAIGPPLPSPQFELPIGIEPILFLFTREVHHHLCVGSILFIKYRYQELNLGLSLMRTLCYHYTISTFSNPFNSTSALRVINPLHQIVGFSFPIDLSTRLPGFHRTSL